MFITYLSPSQQNVFLTIAQDLIAADGVLATEEQALLNVFKAQIEVGIEPITYELDELNQIFNTQKSKISMLLELIGLGHADHNFDATEQEFVNSIAQALNITESEVAECELWVSRQINLVAEAYELIGA